MGLFTPVAIKLGSQPWMPGLLPQITWTDQHLQRLTGRRVSLVGLAGLPSLLLTVKGRALIERAGAILFAGSLVNEATVSIATGSALSRVSAPSLSHINTYLVVST